MTVSGAIVPRALASKSTAAALLLFACSTYDASLLSDQTEAGSGGVPSSAGVGAAPVSGGAGAGSGATGAGVGASSDGGVSSGGGGANGGSSGGSSGGGVVGGAGGTDAGAGGREANGGEGGSPTEPDACPNDANKVAPGKCGCGIPEVDTATLAACQTLIGKLIHRYDFEGSGTAVQDRVGTAHGSLKGASLSKLDGRGVVLLGGGSAGAYVDLPNKLLSTLTNATLEAWVTWGGGSAWQRIFDFGDTTDANNTENKPGLGRTYLMATPKSAAGFATTGFSLTGNASGQEQDVSATVPLSTSLTQVVVVASAADSKLRLYIDGKKITEAAWSGPLSAINDINAWLGRSQYDTDPELNGVFHEFRMYGAALTDAEVASTFVAGTDPAFLAY